MKNVKILFTLLFFVVVLDEIFFGNLIWNLPNESPWGTNHFFNFVYELKKIEKKEKTKKRILAIGSSISYYSIDKKKFEDEFKKSYKEDVELEYLSYAGMTPLDAYLLKEKIISLKPDLVLYLINFIDFRLHRAYVLNPNKTNFETDDYDLLLDALNFGDAPQSKFAFPFETLKEFLFTIPIERSSDYLAAFMFRFFRYREIYFQNLKNLYNHRFSKNISYHGYAGVQIPERINSLGWTTGSFSFETKSYMYEEGFLVEVIPEILKKGFLEISIYDSNSVLKQKINFSKTGWQKITLDSKIKLGSFVKAVLSETWKVSEATGDKKDYSHDLLGIRLQQIFGLDKPLNDMQYVREERLEDLRYLSMNENEYTKYFEYRLLSDFEQRPGIRYLIALRDAKIKLSSEKFRPVLHFGYLKKFSSHMEQNKIQTLIINHPESPISLSWYENSIWYKDHLNYLKSLDSKNVKFLDWRNELGFNDFSDFHHTTYSGLEKLNPRLVEETKTILGK